MDPDPEFFGQEGSKSRISVQDPDPSPDTGTGMTFLTSKSVEFLEVLLENESIRL